MSDATAAGAAVYAPDHIHDLESAAARCKVTEAQIRRWVREGLRATPVGAVGARGPRDYRFLDKWLVEFIEARQTRQAPQPAAGQGEKPKGRPKGARRTTGRPSDLLG